MAILSKRIMDEMARIGRFEHGMPLSFLNLSGLVVRGHDVLGKVPDIKRRRGYGVQASVTDGEPYIFSLAPGLLTWVVALENKRTLHGALTGGAVLDGRGAHESLAAIGHLARSGMPEPEASELVEGLPSWPLEKLRDAAFRINEAFYRISGWTPVLMEENRIRSLQQHQINQAINELREKGKHALYAFEKERVLLANIRAGERNEARRILNEMLAAIYMSSPRLIVLRARAVELMSCLTRAAIEDNPLLEPLIERNHTWTDRLVAAGDFEELSEVLMAALDDFIDGIFLHGVNRSNMKVRKALDFISANFMHKVTLKTVAREAEVSPCRLSHLVKEHTGRTVLQILRQVRVRHAQRLLERTEKSCTEIAYEVGYEDQSYFIKHFKGLTGTTPAQYRKSRTGKDAGMR